MKMRGDINSGNNNANEWDRESLMDDTVHGTSRKMVKSAA